MSDSIKGLRVTEANIDLVTLSHHGKPWRIVTDFGVFDSDRACERWIIPVPGESHLERVFRLDSVRIDPKADDFTAFYVFETTRST